VIRLLIFALALFIYSVAVEAQISCTQFIGSYRLQPVNNSLVGKEDLSHDIRLLKFIVNQIRNLRKATDFPQIEWAALENLSLLTGAGGKGNAGIYKAVHQNKHVAIKVLNLSTRSSESGMVREAKTLLQLNKLNLGVEFIGFTRTPKGELALVTQFLSGTSVSMHQDSHHEAGNQAKITSQTLSDVLTTAKGLIFLGYQITIDMQFMITNEGRALLIDPEFFYLHRPKSLPMNLSFPVTPYASAQLIERGLSPYVVDDLKTETPEARLYIP